ncbi:MAG: hypothetical protein GEU28_11860 [Dehalococcoidia bacterium]|nr:hypothetical protein [Dehalococcoidia bacterium]
MRLLVMIVSDTDADRLMRRLVEVNIPATKVSSTGGFLRKGSATILSGVAGEQVDEVVELVREECRARTEYVPAQMLPFLEAPYLSAQTQVRVGGGIVFVLPVERFVKT